MIYTIAVMKAIEKILFGSIRATTKKEDNYIIFESSDYFYDNSYELFKYVRENYKNYKIKYIVTNKAQREFGLKIGLKNSDMISYKNKVALYKYSLKAKVIFFSYDNYWKNMKLNEGTKLVNLGHGEFPIKDCSKYYDYILGPQVNTVESIFGGDKAKEILEAKYPHFKTHPIVINGFPRNDEIFKNSCKKADFLKDLGINEDLDIICSLCTFRNEHKQDAKFFQDEYPINLSDEDLVKLNNLLKENKQLLLIKIHHAQKGTSIPENLSNIKFIENEYLIEKGISNSVIYSLSKAMLTDYSSAFYAFLLLYRKIGFITVDKAKYEANRGFTVKEVDNYLPGEKIWNKEELFDFFKNLDKEDRFTKERENIRKGFVGDHRYDNCKAICDYYL